MINIRLKAKSSSGEFYEVVFEIEEKIKVNCNCEAGKYGKLCKHKIGLLSGDISLLYDSKEKSKFEELILYVERSTYLNLLDELNHAETVVENAKKEVKKLKNKLELSLKEGFTFKTNE